MRRYHLEKMEYFKHRTDVKYVFIMHDDRTYTEQIGENACIEHLEVPKVMGNWEYRYLWKKEKLKPLLTKINPDIIEVGSPYFMPKMINALVKENNMKAKVFGFWHADFPVTYVKRFLSKMPFGIANFGEARAWNYAQKHYNRMAGVLASSQVIIDRMKENAMENVHFVPLGVDAVLFHPSKKDDDLIQKMKAGNPERLFMFFPHRFSYEKGVHLLLESYAQLCELLPVEPVLLFAGTGPSQPAVEEAVAAGATRLVFITHRSKGAIERHFQTNFELESILKDSGKDALLQLLHETVPEGVRFYYVEQGEPLGLGHAVLCAKEVVGNEPFFVHLPDGMMRAPSRPKPVGTIIEDGLVLGRECLRDGLLDQAIEHCRDSKGAGLPLAFWDGDPPDW